MWSEFFLENAHFALSLFGALIMFAIAWLYFDAWLVRKSSKEGVRMVGYFFLSFSYIIGASIVESAFLTAAFIAPELQTMLFLGTHVVGYLFVAISLFMDPMQPKPEIAQEPQPAQAPTMPPKAPLAAVFLPQSIGVIAAPLGAFLVAGLYIQRATTGLERHLKKVGLGFTLIGVSELIGLRSLLVSSPNVDIYTLVRPFGPIWLIQNIVLFIGLLLLGKWIFGYLLKRFETQLFMVFVSSILVIFLLTTVSFTSLLLNNLLAQNLNELSTDVNVLSLFIDGKKAESQANAELIAQDPRVVDAIVKNDRRSVAQIATNFLVNKKQSMLLIVNPNAVVVANGEDVDKYGDSVSSDALVKQALTGQAGSAIISVEGILSPTLYVRAAAPIKNGQTIIGVAVSGDAIDTALLDGIKKATGLDVSLYGGNTLAATTLVTHDGVNRPIGIKEQSQAIQTSVLKNGTPYTGSISLLNRPFVASYLPLNDATNTPVGMIMAGRPELTILTTASRSIELTFLVTTILLLLTPIPAFFISSSIAKQVH